MLREETRDTGDAGAAWKFVERSVAFAEGDGLGVGFQRGEQVAEAPDSAEIDGGLREAALAPGGFQFLRWRRILFPTGIGDLEQISAKGATKILAGIVAQIGASDAAEAEVGLTHARRRSGERGHGTGLFLSSQILVGSVDPVGARWRKDVEVDSVFEGFGFVRHVGGNAESFAGVYDDLFAVDPELESAFEDVGELLVVMAVLGDDASFFQKDAGEHDFLADDELAL